MKKLLFFFFPFFLFANSFLYQKYSDSGYINNVLKLTTPGDTCSILHLDYPNHEGYSWYVINGYVVTLSGGMDNYNSACIEKTYSLNFKFKLLVCDDHPHLEDAGYMSALINDDYCKNKPGCVFLQDAGYWKCKGDDNNPPKIICPSGYVYSSSQNKCITLSDCPSGDVLTKNGCMNVDDYLKSILSPSDYQYYKQNCQILNRSVSINSGSLCVDSIICQNQNVASFQVSCGSGSDENSTLVCTADEDIQISSDGSVKCVPDKVSSNISHVSSSSNDSNSSDSSSSSSSNNSSSSSNNSSNNSSNSSSNNSDNNSSSGSNSSNSVNCCDRYNNPQLGDTWTQVSPGEWKMQNSPYCVVYFHDGQCSVKSDNNGSSGVSGSQSGDGNSSSIDYRSYLTNISDEINSTNSKLQEIIDLKPNKTYDSNLSSDESSFFSGFVDTVKNMKNSIDDISNSFKQVSDLLNNPKQLTLFKNNNVYTCPISADLYGKHVSADICKMVSPYRSMIQVFFTIFLSILVVIHFLEIILKGAD